MTRLSQALTWLAEEPDHSFTLNMVFLRGWPGLAEFLLLPKPWTLGRAAWTLEKVLLKVGAVLVGPLTQGAERVMLD